MERTEQKRIYLAGPIDNTLPHEPLGWRMRVGDALAAVDLGYLCPMRDGEGDMRIPLADAFASNDPSIIRDICADIVTKDLALIDRSAGVIVNMMHSKYASVGTSMEIFYASQQLKPVVVFNYDGLSAFMFHHIDSVHENALGAILRLRTLLEEPARGH